MKEVRFLLFLGVLGFLFSLSFVSGACTPAYSCTYQPEICPASGNQTQRCVDSSCGLPEKLVTLSCSPGQCAEGCVYQGRCVPFGTRIAGQYCGYDKTLIA